MAWAWAPKTSSKRQNGEGDATRGAPQAKARRSAIAARAIMLAVASALLAALSVRSLASPLLTMVALTPLFVATQGARPRKALALGWLTATLASFIGYAFVPPALVATGSLTAPLAWAALAGFALFRGAWLGLALGAAALAGRRRSLLLSPVLIVASELVLPNPLPFAFGTPLVMWPALGQVASVFGAGGLTLLAALVSAGVAALLVGPARRDERGEKQGGGKTGRREAESFFGRDWWVVAACFGLPLGAFLFGVAHMAAGADIAGELGATLLHADRDPRAPGALPELPTGRELLVLPESAIPSPLPEAESDALVRELVAGSGRPLLVGVSERTSSGRLRNVGLLIEPGVGVVGRYEKQKLLPFAEATFEPGRVTDAITVAGTPISVAICSEELDAAVIRAGVRDRGAEAIIALSNDAWFQGSFAAELHLLAARARAIETGRSVLRASNGGVSAAIDPYGRVIARTGTPGPVDVAAPLSDRTTPYLRFGNALLWILLAALAALSLALRGFAPRV